MHNAPVWGAGFNPQGDHVVSATQDGTISIFQLSQEA